MPNWDPDLYARYAAYRDRPFHDLLARVELSAPRLVVDLGCGNGPLTLALADRWPDARVVGIDSSPAMLAAARGLDPTGRVEWVEEDLTSWHPDSLGAAPDLVLAAASLQWVPGHLDLLPGWLAALVPGGVLAFHVPRNHDAPSHALMREIAAAQPRSADLVPALRRMAVADPTAYLGVLLEGGSDADVWETTYLHVLDAPSGADHPVVSWVSGTGLRPVLDLLDDAERQSFVADYAARLADAYPVRDGRVVLPFRRLFAVAVSP